MSQSPFPPSFPLQPFSSKPVFESTRPRIQVMIAGQYYDTALGYEVVSPSHGATGNATIEMPISGNPDWSLIVKNDDPSDTSPIPCEIYLDLNSTGVYAGRFAGNVDMYQADLARDVITFTCRNMAAPLTSSKITTPFTAGSSITTVSFIQQQAARFGLSTNIILAPGQQPGQMIDVLGSEFVTGVRNWTVLDLLLQCAQYDDVDLWADRFGVLHYEAASYQQRNPLDYAWGSNVIDCLCTHSPQFSRNVQVEVHSYTKRTRTSSISRAQSLPGGGMQTTTSSRTVVGNPIPGTNSYTTTIYNPNGTKTTTTSTISGGSASSGPTSFWSSTSGVQRYVFYVRNKTVQQCDQLAQQIWRQISAHEYSIKLTVPITLANIDVMDVTCSIGFTGGPYAGFNIPAGPQTGYWPREIVERVDTEAGAVWEIHAVSAQLPQGAV